MAGKGPLYSEDPVAKAISDRYVAEQTGVNHSGNWAGSVGVEAHRQKQQSQRTVAKSSPQRSSASASGGYSSPDIGLFKWTALSTIVAVSVALICVGYISQQWGWTGWPLWITSIIAGVAVGSLTTLATAILLWVAAAALLLLLLVKSIGWAWASIFG